MIFESGSTLAPKISLKHAIEYR